MLLASNGWGPQQLLHTLKHTVGSSEGSPRFQHYEAQKPFFPVSLTHNISLFPFNGLKITRTCPGFDRDGVVLSLPPAYFYKWNFLAVTRQRSMRRPQEEGGQAR